MALARPAHLPPSPSPSCAGRLGLRGRSALPSASALSSFKSVLHPATQAAPVSSLTLRASTSLLPSPAQPTAESTQLISRAVSRPHQPSVGDGNLTRLLPFSATRPNNALLPTQLTRQTLSLSFPSSPSLGRLHMC